MIQTIETERLSIRRIRAEDWKDIQAIWVSAAKSVYAQYDWPNDLDDDSVQTRVAGLDLLAESDAHIFLAICLKNRLIGYFSLNERGEGYEIGYCFHSDFHGKGYARESSRAVLGFLRNRGVPFVEAGTALRNTPSLRLLRSLGFKLCGTEKVSFYQDAEGKDIFFDGGIFVRRLDCDL